MGAMKLLPILSAQDEGRRLRELRQMAGLNQGALAEYLGYEPSQSANVSKIEKGYKRSTGEGKRKVANFLAGKGSLTDDPFELHGYLIGDHDSLDACRRPRGQAYERCFTQTPSEQVERVAA